MSEQRKSEISAMTRKELNGQAYLLEQEQHEYEKDIARLRRKLQVAEWALETIEEQCNCPHDMEIARKAIEQINW